MMITESPGRIGASRRWSSDSFPAKHFHRLPCRVFLSGRFPLPTLLVSDLNSIRHCGRDMTEMPVYCIPFPRPC